MMLQARIGDASVAIDDETPGTLSYTPEHIEDLARRLGRQAILLYTSMSTHDHALDMAELEALEDE